MAGRHLPPMVIGLGGQRCGSTWLHAQLAHHPDIQVPGATKEVHFFDRNWGRGLDWYAGLFAGGDGARWESTPYYLYDKEARERIADAVADPRFVVLLRDPKARSLSHYNRYLANTTQVADFRDAVRARPSILGFSRYSRFLDPYFRRFGRDRFLVAFCEDIVTRPAGLIDDVLNFMGLPKCELPDGALLRRVNGAPVPRYPSLHAASERGKRWLNRRGFGGAVQFARAIGVRRVITGPAERANEAPLRASEMRLLEAMRHEEIAALRSLDIDAGRWAA